MTLYGENPFKIKSYQTAYNVLRKHGEPLIEASEASIANIPGIGKAITEKILQIQVSGSFPTLDRYLDTTPEGIVQMLGIKGLGPKKVKLLWDDLQIETPGELLYACNENRLIELKGFGVKTQENFRQQLEYYFESSGKFHLASIWHEAHALQTELRTIFPNDLFDLVGDIARQNNICESIEIISTTSIDIATKGMLDDTESGHYYNGVPLEWHTVPKSEYYFQKINLSAAVDYLDHYNFENDKDAQSESDIYTKSKIPFHAAYLRESENLGWLANKKEVSEIIQQTSIKGVVHSHTQWSDGGATIEDMVAETERLGYEYIVITDHSKSAFYANGLSEERLLQQIDIIRQVDEKSNIKVFAGIEADILYDGSLDYGQEILSKLDVVIGSVHSVLKMDKAKATERLLGAICSGQMHILGHPTGRLLLSRQGYPVDFDSIIDACADHHVSIELNANPHRLDLDWRWIDKARNKGILISINPDAHSLAGIQDITYGVFSAQKAGLKNNETLNALNAEEFLSYLQKI